MIFTNSLDCLKSVAELQSNIISGGVLFLITDGCTIIWRKESAEFNPDIFKVGEKFSCNNVVERAIKERKTVTDNAEASLYGMKLKIVAEPLFSDNGYVTGTFLTIVPKFHPIAKAFSDFAPIIAEMFPEGSVLTFTDLKKIIYKQPSKKFDLPMQIGDSIVDKHPGQIIKTKKPDIIEDSGSKSGFSLGMPLLIANYPIFDNENPNEIVGTFGIITPKKTEVVVRQLSDNLESNLTEISATVQQLAAASSNIHINEQELNSEIGQVTDLSEKINEVLVFIENIANQTKMLGLNASIEAARAGEAGRGFEVVAKEIRKLSDQSKNTVPKIKELTNSIKLKVDASSEKSQSSLALSQQQAAATEEATASIEEITTMAQELKKLAHKL